MAGTPPWGSSSLPAWTLIYQAVIFCVFINEANATVVRMTDPFIADSVENTLQKIFEVHLPADDEWKILKSRGVPEYTMSVEDVEALASQE